MSEERVLNSDEVFLLWKKEAKELGTTRFTAEERKGQLTLLGDMFFLYNIDMDEAKMFSNQVVSFMVTLKGKKNVGKHKGWSETVKEDFIGSLLQAYVNLDKKLSERKVDDVDENVVDLDPIKVKWVDDNYFGNEFILKQVHNPISWIFLDFIEDIYDGYVV